MVSSKVFWGGKKPTQRGLSAKHVTDGAHMALKRLQVDYLDLYFCHRPDIETPIEETVRAMHNLVQQGKVIYWGTSEWNAQQLTEAHLRRPPRASDAADHGAAGIQHVPARERREGLSADLRAFGLGTTIWSPLASGFLTGKYNDGIPADSRVNLPGYEWLKRRSRSAEGKAKIEKVKKLAVLAKEIGLPVHHMALLWCNANPNVSTVILGASKKSQLLDNLKALDSKAKMTPDVMAKIEEILQNKPEAPRAFALE